MNSWAFKMKCKQTFAPNWASFFWLVFILWIKRPWTKELLPELQYGGWLNLLNVFEESNLGDLVWFPPQGHELLLLANLPRTSSKNKHIDVGQWFVWRCAKREFSIVAVEFLPCVEWTTTGTKYLRSWATLITENQNWPGSVYECQCSSVPKLRAGAEHLVPLQTDSSVYAQGSCAV